MKEQETQQFILQHRNDDVRRLALEGSRNPDIDLPFALDQIQGWQTARTKLPSWAALDDIVYPPHLNMEQCSSEQTARYKHDVMGRLIGDGVPDSLFVDLTGGYGVDFFFMSSLGARSLYVERSEPLCALVAHNMRVLGRSSCRVVCGDGTSVLHELPATPAARPFTMIYMDPARRGTHGQKVFGLSDCEPDVTVLRDALMARADVVMLKLSPMLDWHEAVRQLCPDGLGCEVHIVSVGGECKELLLVMTHGSSPLRVVCANDGDSFAYMPPAAGCPSRSEQPPAVATSLEGWLLVPNASIMKAGCFDEVASRFGVRAIDRNSHLFVADSAVDAFPGRQFRIMAVSTMNKRQLREMLAGVTHANIAVRNFPLSVAELRKRLKLRDGGSIYLFATTWQGQRVIMLCQRAPMLMA